MQKDDTNPSAKVEPFRRRRETVQCRLSPGHDALPHVTHPFLIIARSDAFVVKLNRVYLGVQLPITDMVDEVHLGLLREMADGDVLIPHRQWSMAGDINGPVEDIALLQLMYNIMAPH